MGLTLKIELPTKAIKSEPPRYEFEDIARIINPSRKGREFRRNADVTNFGLWADGDISAEECQRKFLENHGRTDVAFSKWHFERWLNSLGYFRTYEL